MEEVVSRILTRIRAEPKADGNSKDSSKDDWLGWLLNMFFNYCPPNVIALIISGCGLKKVNRVARREKDSKGAKAVKKDSNKTRASEAKNEAKADNVPSDGQPKEVETVGNLLG